MKQNNQPTAQSNLNEIFKNFTVVTQQRHKVKLNEVNQFNQQPIAQADESGTTKIDTNGSLITSIFSQINPFAQFVIKDVFEDSKNAAAAKEKSEADAEDAADKQKKNWELHESLFKKGPNHKVNPDNLIKSSSQMFTVYKYCENPNLLVKSQTYTGKDDFQEIKQLVPNIQFYDAPEAPMMPMMPQPPAPANAEGGEMPQQVAAV